MGVFVGVIEWQGSGEDPSVFVCSTPELVERSIFAELSVLNRDDLGDDENFMVENPPPVDPSLEQITEWLALFRDATTVPWFSRYDEMEIR